MADFRRLCVATDGATDQVKAAAQQSGWTAVPAEAFGTEDDVEIHAAFMVADGDGVRMVAVMKGEIEPGVFGKGCLVGAEPARAPSLETEARTLAAVRQHASMSIDGSVFVYVDEAAGRRDLSAVSEDDLIEMAKTRPVKAVFFANRDNLVMIALMDLGAE